MFDNRIVVVEIDSPIPWQKLLGEGEGQRVDVMGHEIMGDFKVGDHVVLAVRQDPHCRDGGDQRMNRWLNGRTGTVTEILPEFDPEEEAQKYG